MKEPIIERLQQDAQAIHQLADERLAQLNLANRLQPQLQRRPARWPWAVAAAICLMILAGVLTRPQLSAPADLAPLNAEVPQPMQLDLQQFPARLEQSVNQPLLDEQQAILEDLKTLRKAMLSI
jgi:hypothetical protein